MQIYIFFATRAILPRKKTLLTTQNTTQKNSPYHTKKTLLPLHHTRAVTAPKKLSFPPPQPPSLPSAASTAQAPTTHSASTHNSPILCLAEAATITLAQAASTQNFCRNTTARMACAHRNLHTPQPTKAFIRPQNLYTPPKKLTFDLQKQCGTARNATPRATTQLWVTPG